MPKRKKKKPANKQALAFAVKHAYRAFPVIQVHAALSGDVVDVTLDLGFTLFKKERVSLSGIVAPSIRTKAAEEKELGNCAKLELARLLREATQLECVVDGKDGVGRTSGVFFGQYDESVNEKLLNTGFVWSSSDTVRDVEMLQILQGNEF